MSFNKKASLEISIQAIVIVVLAMTLLGLGLGFIRGMFKNISGTTEDVSEQIKEQILNDLRTGDKTISFPKTEVTISKGGSTVLNVGIRNKDNVPLRYGIRFDAISEPDSTGTRSVSISSSERGKYDSWFQIPTPSTGWLLPASESDIRSIRVAVPKSDTISGSYAFTFDVVAPISASGEVAASIDIYATKDFFIVVTG